MRSPYHVFGTLLATLLPIPGFAQAAQVYLSTPSAIYAFNAASDGRLTKVPGSPFSGGKNAALSSMVVNGKYLFIVNGDGSPNSVSSNIDTWLMAPDGALKKRGTTNISSRVGNFVNIDSIVLDHSGQTLYVGVLGNAFLYLSFNIEKESGELNYTGEIGGYPFVPPLSFSGNNLYGYAAICGDLGLSLLGYNRLEDGVLIGGTLDASFPLTSPSDGFCPFETAAADPYGHVAFSFQALKQPGFYAPDGAAQLAAYATDSEGHLTTTSTYLNMPRVEVGYINNMNMSPSGKLLAVGGDLGLQVFHFNGASPITRFTGLINQKAGADGGVFEFYWDNKDHLYAVFPDNHLRVYTITPTSIVEAPGSPTPLPNDPGFTPALAVQVLPRNTPYHPE
jgi:hypothetical protein